MLAYSPDVTDYAHVIKVIEEEKRLTEKYKEVRRMLIEKRKKKL